MLECLFHYSSEQRNGLFLCSIFQRSRIIWGYSDTVQVSPAAAVNFHSDFLSFLLLWDHIALAANLACCVLHSTHTQKAKHNLSTHPNTRIFTHKRGLACSCLFLLEKAIWRATQQELVLFSSLHSIFHTPSDSFGVLLSVTGVLSWDRASGKN